MHDESVYACVKRFVDTLGMCVYDLPNNTTRMTYSQARNVRANGSETSIRYCSK